MTENVWKQFKECAEFLSENGFAKAEGTRILFQEDGKVYGTKHGADISKLTEEDVERLNVKRLPVPKKRENAMIFSQTFYCQKCLAEAVPFATSLDDAAQVIGQGVFVADGRSAEHAAGKSLRKALKKNRGCLVLRAVDGKGKGVGYSITIGKDLREAATALAVMEKAAEAEWKAKRIGGSRPLETKLVLAMKKNYEKNYSKQQKVHTELAADISERELTLRKQIVEYGKLLVEKKLVQGTWGNLSVSLDDENMLITPSGIDYALLTEADIVKVNIETLAEEGANRASSEKELHAEIYKNRADVSAIVHAHSSYASVFACACKGIPVPSKEKEAREIFGSFIPAAEYALAGTHELALNVSAALGEGAAAVMAHHGMVVCGSDIENAFSNALKFEETARIAWYDYEEEEEEDEDEEYEEYEATEAENE